MTSPAPADRSPPPPSPAPIAGAETDHGTQAHAQKAAGRGLLSITGAKLYFIVAGYVMQLALPRVLGGPEPFGLYSSAMSLVSILTNVMIAATIQTVSKRVSETPARAGSLLREGLVLQAAIGGGLGALLALGADALATHVLLDPLLTPLLRISAVVVFCYALYATLVGALNGRQRFHDQAILDVSYTTLRTVGIVGAAALGFGAVGASSGFALAALLILLIALMRGGTGEASARESGWTRSWLKLMAPLWLYQLFLNLTLQVDLAVLKGNVAAIAQDAGVLAEAAAETASRYAGLYRAAQTFAFVPYQLILSVTFVVFPLVAQAVTLGDAEATKSYVRGAMRFSLLVLLAIAAPVSGASAGVMQLAYPDAYMGGAAALAVLALGMVCFALFVIGATVISGAGRPGLAASIALATVVIVVTCNLLFVRAVGLGERTLLAAAAGTSCGTLFALIAIGFAVRAQVGTFLPLLSTLRTLAAAAIAWSVAHALPSGSAIGALSALVGGGVAYLVALGVLRELGPAELAIVKRVLKR